METIIAVVLVTAAAVLVAWPFFGRQSAPAPGEIQLSPLQRQKLEAYAAIKEAEFDYQMGKLTAVDFNALRERYTQQALAAIAALESAQARRSAATPRGTESRKPGRIAYCPSCGHNLTARANFCHGCGQSLKAIKETAG
ncbi:MAG: zinc ribbon domain-containing protein [Deltaproteobacteria bacterium]|nr:zinc ribbon domain-containing protein [Deltaproteobacteria bacterium]